MLGIIIYGTNKDGKFNEHLYYKFRQRTIFEHTLDNALQVEQAQKVIVSIPLSQRSNINGGGINHPLINANRMYLNRKALFHFYLEKEDVIAGFYFAALTYNLDHIAIIHADCPILPAWLMNAMIYEYMSETNQNILMQNDYNSGFQMTILPFWMLANHYLYSEDRMELIVNNPTIFKGNKELALPNSNFDFKFKNYDKIKEFEFLLNEMAKGADLGDLIEDLNE